MLKNKTILFIKLALRCKIMSKENMNIKVEIYLEKSDGIILLLFKKEEPIYVKII